MGNRTELEDLREGSVVLQNRFVCRDVTSPVLTFLARVNKWGSR